MKLYLESSVWNFCFAEDVPDKQQATIRFFAGAATGHDLHISVLVLEELDRTADERRRELLFARVEEVSPVLLDWSDEVGIVADRVLETGGFSERLRVDALHVGYAVVHGMDALVSWNMRDLVRLKTKRVVSAVCRLLGYKELDIVTPEEV